MKAIANWGHHLIHDDWTDLEILLYIGLPTGIIIALLLRLADFSHLF
jgi:hypothetical protein